MPRKLKALLSGTVETTLAVNGLDLYQIDSAGKTFYENEQTSTLNVRMSFSYSPSQTKDQIKVRSNKKNFRTVRAYENRLQMKLGQN